MCGEYRRQLLWMLVRQTMQQHRVHHAKDRCVCSDAQRERENHDGGEAWAFCQDSGRVANVLPYRLNPCKDPRFAAIFFYQRDVSKSTQRSSAGVICTKPQFAVLFCALGQMKLQFFLEVALQ